MFAKKFICISGASAGIGEACAYLSASEGHSLFLGARRLDRLEVVRKKCLEQGAKDVFISALDVSDPYSCQRFAEYAEKQSQGKIDVLLNNAGLAIGMDHIKDGKPEEWQTVFDVNVMGTMRLCRLFLPKMVENKRGHIVFLSSIAAHHTYDGGGAYCASKHAVKAIAGVLKSEINGTGLRVTTIDPGMVETEFSDVRFRGDQERAKKVYAGMTPLTPADIARCISFAINSPEHVNIDQMILTPTDQASISKVYRRST